MKLPRELRSASNAHDQSPCCRSQTRRPLPAEADATVGVFGQPSSIADILPAAPSACSTAALSTYAPFFPCADANAFTSECNASSCTSRINAALASQGRDPAGDGSQPTEARHRPSISTGSQPQIPGASFPPGCNESQQQLDQHQAQSQGALALVSQPSSSMFVLFTTLRRHKTMILTLGHYWHYVQIVQMRLQRFRRALTVYGTP
jgi:hypothetical protein